MSSEYLGETFDIHGGGTDLLFPHHENEIAQSEAGNGRPLARYWMHNGMVNMARAEEEGEAEKMSKSLGNVVGLRETLARAGGQTVRYFCIAAHYSSTVPFTESALEQAGAALERLRIGRQTLDRLAQRAPTRPTGAGLEELQEAAAAARADFEEAMDDDFGTPRALAALHGLGGAVNRVGASADASFAVTEQGRAALGRTRDTLVDLAGALGLSLEQEGVMHNLTADLVQLLIEVRQQARALGQYGMADAIRARLGELGVALEDRPEGTTWRRR